ncbi:MAG: hypothetical protein H7Y59_07330 [Anaerolineales bacterium]|nr:hypothetical protein [Anaerolineales bacterium]
MNIVFLIASIFTLLYSARSSFFWWFQTKEYIKMNQRKRKEYRKKLFFMPQVILFDYYDQNPEFELWMNRIVSLIFLAASIFGIVLSFHGPFTIL